jgi:hypothetical protein
MTINYLIGDATRPQITNDEIGYICHIVNNYGVWGAGFVIALSNRWSEPEQYYHLWANTKKINGTTFKLGNIQKVQVDKKLYVINMLAQDGFISKNNKQPCKLDAVEQCFQEINNLILLDNIKYAAKISLHMPRIGCGLGGQTWENMEVLLKKYFININVYVYDLK